MKGHFRAHRITGPAVTLASWIMLYALALTAIEDRPVAAILAGLGSLLPASVLLRSEERSGRKP